VQRQVLLLPQVLMQIFLVPEVQIAVPVQVLVALKLIAAPVQAVQEAVRVQAQVAQHSSFMMMRNLDYLQRLRRFSRSSND
jgi:hypothetical protein